MPTNPMYTEFIKAYYVIIGATITSVCALIGIIINIVINLGQSKKQRTAEIITTNRVEWMQKLKDYVSEYIGMVEFYYDKPIPNDLNLYLSQLYCITTKIKLHLNFNGKQDKEIISKIQLLNESYEKIFQLSKNQNIFSDNEGLKKEALQKIIDYYLEMHEKEMGQDIGLNILKEANIDINNIEQCKKFYNKYIENNKKYQEKIPDKLLEYIDSDMRGCMNKIESLSELITLLLQIYLKTEWERVKIESKAGNSNKFNFNKRYEKIRKNVQGEIDSLMKKIDIGDNNVSK